MLGALAAAAVVFGAVMAVQPKAGLLLFGACVMLAFLRLAPATLLLALLFVTVLVPFSVQNQFSIGGGHGSPGVLLSDVFLIAGVVRVAPMLLQRGLERRVRVMAVCIAAFLCVAVLQFLRSALDGRDLSVAGYELRVLLGFAAFLIAVPVVRDEEGRRRLLKGMLVLGVCLGLWGLLQWGLQLGYSESGDVGVREGVRLTSTGRGQVQGGLFAFPVAVLTAGAVLALGRIESFRTRLVLMLIIGLNGLCLIVTYERTFWLATTFAAGLVALRARGGQRARAVLGGVALALGVLMGMATLAPDDFTAVRERLMSLSQYKDDNSVKFRLVETRHVIEAVREHPVAGSGLAASVFFGRPWELVRPYSVTFAHNGYLWVAWKLGVPGAVLLFGAFALGLAWRAPRDGPPLVTAVRVGTQASLVALLISTVTFPSVNQLSITAAMSVVLALAATAAPRVAWPTPQSVGATSSAD